MATLWSSISELLGVTPAQQKEATRRRAQGATLQELADSYVAAYRPCAAPRAQPDLHSAGLLARCPRTPDKVYLETQTPSTGRHQPATYLLAQLSAQREKQRRRKPMQVAPIAPIFGSLAYRFCRRRQGARTGSLTRSRQRERRRKGPCFGYRPTARSFSR